MKQHESPFQEKKVLMQATVSTSDRAISSDVSKIENFDMPSFWPRVISPKMLKADPNVYLFLRLARQDFRP
jgi:hypothetical protein